MIDRTNLTKKQCEFLDMVDRNIAQWLEDSENWKTYSIDEVRMILKNNIKNHKNSNTKQGLWIMM